MFGACAGVKVFFVVVARHLKGVRMRAEYVLGLAGCVLGLVGWWCCAAGGDKTPFCPSKEFWGWWGICF